MPLSMRCVSCQAKAVPKTYAPSTLSLETTIWVVAIVVGLAAGVVSTTRNSSTPPVTDVVESRMLASLSGVSRVETEEAEPAPTANISSANIVVESAAWFSRISLRFLATAWWAVIIPVLFSLWRQFAKYEGCRRCGSRELVSIPPPT
jgi:hypothetical protein